MITNFIDITIGTVNINIVLLGNTLIWKRDKGLAKDYPGTGWYKATDTGTIFNKDVPEGETYTFEDDPKEYISVYTNEDVKLYADRAATSNITKMSFMFITNSTFNGDISHWDVSNVYDMEDMFRNATSFNGDISSWDTSNVVFMSSMFRGATAFNEDISSWDTSNALTMSHMFNGATAFNQDLSEWCVSKVAKFPNGFNNSTPNWTLPKPVWGTCPRGENTP